MDRRLFAAFTVFSLTGQTPAAKPKEAAAASPQREDPQSGLRAAVQAEVQRARIEIKGELRMELRSM